MTSFIDIGKCSVNKFGEELCGDNVEVIRLENYTIVVLADGLGSGVKANILSSMTCKIAATMLKEGVDIYETIDTLASTLPVCKVRNIAYATFTILKIYNDGTTYIFEYDNPPIVILNNGKYKEVDKEDLIIKDKNVKKTKILLEEGDSIVIVSDGAVHAGIGNLLNLGWTWECVKDFAEKVSYKKEAKDMAKSLISVCWELYGEKPGDDTTAVVVKFRKPEIVNVFTGPPKDIRNDRRVIYDFMEEDGKKIICGGTSANIAERILKKKLEVDMSTLGKDIPPIAVMEGIDLVTEGVLTIGKAIEKIKRYVSEDVEYEYDLFNDNNGVDLLCKNLVYDCTHINFFVGRAINPAHQNPEFPVHLSIKLNLINDLVESLRKIGKEVKVIYY